MVFYQLIYGCQEVNMKMSENFEDDDLVLDKTVNDIINQIKSQSQTIKKVEKEQKTLSKEDLEKFVIDNAATVVNDSVEMIQGIKDVLMTCPADSKLIESTAELVKAVTGAIDSLSKLKLSDDKIKASKELKQMDIDAKNIDVPSGTVGLLISREDLFKELKNLDKIKEPDNAIDV